MNPSYTIRRAAPTLADAEALLRVEQGSLADSPYSAERVRAILARTEHHAYLAARPLPEGGEEAVGFCSTFETPLDAGDGLRLEIDMLGVLPEHRGRGLATRLIRRAVEDARGRGVRAFRGVVAEENVASQRAFCGAGLRPEPSGRELLIYSIGGTSPVELPGGLRYARLDAGSLPVPGAAGEPFDASPGRPVHCVTTMAGHTVALAASLCVHTLSYEGLWIERLWAEGDLALRAAIRAVVEEAKRLGLDEVGHLGSAADDPWLREGYLSMGRYRVFALGPNAEAAHPSSAAGVSGSAKGLPAPCDQT